MECPTVGMAWKTYEKKFLKSSSAVTRKALRQVFFTGAFACIAAQSEAVKSAANQGESAMLLDYIVDDVRINLGMKPLKEVG